MSRIRVEICREANFPTHDLVNLAGYRTEGNNACAVWPISYLFADDVAIIDEGDLSHQSSEYFAHLSSCEKVPARANLASGRTVGPRSAGSL